MKDWEARIKRWWMQGLTAVEIAQRLGTNANAVRKEMHCMRDRGIDLPFRTAMTHTRRYEPATYETADAVDPDVLLYWLEAQGILRDLLDDGVVDRQIRRWRVGAVPSFWVVDRLLTRLGLHIAALPDEAWLKLIRTAMPSGAKREVA